KQRKKNEQYIKQYEAEIDTLENEERIREERIQRTKKFMEIIQKNLEYSYKDYLNDGGIADKTIFKHFKKRVLKGKQTSPSYPYPL
ncbi:MAG: hypothetical protein ACFFDH_25595, partial [Promethearchaeota archaeon]